MRAIQVVTGPWTLRNLAAWTALIAGILLVKAILFDQYTVPSGSMEPTIHGDPGFFQGDRVLVNKAAFGLRVPLTDHYLVTWGAPKRWDIVVFENPQDESPHQVLIKRVVALPGEHVLIKDGGIHINGEPVPIPEDMPEDLHYVNAFEMQLRMHLTKVEPDPEQREYLARVWKRHPVRYASEIAPGVLPKPQYCEVPEGHYFLLGDNSLSEGQFSVDSRVWGWLPREKLLGRAVAIWWPWAHRRDFTGWTDTYVGLGLLYGIPAAIVLIELVLWWRKRRKRAA